MEKMRRARYTLEFKLEALRLIGAGQSIAAVAATLGLADQTLHNWIKAQREGRLGRPGSKPVSPEQMELARLRAELGKTKMALATHVEGNSGPWHPCRQGTGTHAHEAARYQGPNQTQVQGDD